MSKMQLTIVHAEQGKGGKGGQTGTTVPLSSLEIDYNNGAVAGLTERAGDL